MHGSYRSQLVSALRCSARLAPLSLLLVAGLTAWIDHSVTEPSVPAPPDVQVQPDGVGTDASLTFAQVSAGAKYSCGVTATTNLAYCWGSDSSGQLGDGTGGTGLFRTEATRVVGGLTFR